MAIIVISHQMGAGGPELGMALSKRLGYRYVDQELLQDLVRAAVNEASRRVDEELTNQLKSITGGIPGMAGMKIPGLF